MRDLSRHHVLLFALFFLALFAALFLGVIEVHKREGLRHSAASYTPASPQSSASN